ncbi:putative sulfate transporterc/MT1781 [Ruegeria denitrificans]|uniref:Putative sulfate transporterc/MT1781 n=1 Tax=Ruegeria denitrificans TaxID=1715692 RepID=A0A0P1IKH4_9RHOB|nr:SulP family inorganic anion transporter [Ruegeria denitrificans]CUK19960.1 putative sulfate transporterc/MT1781 [Ruegeria denitrificans]
MLDGLKIDRRNVVSDLVAGATFAIVNVPQGMANAVLATVNPVAGLYALMVAMPVGAIFTSSVFMNVSTTGALSVAVGEALYGVEDDRKIGALIGLVMMIGMVQLIFGLLRMGRLVRYVSNSVMTGFITGIAALIILGSIPDITRFESAQPNHLLRLSDTALNWRSFDTASVIIGVATIVLIFLIQQTRLSKFSLVLALGATTGLATLFQGGSIVLVKDVAIIPRSLPTPMLPDLSYFPELILPAIAIAVIGLVQGAGVGQSFPNPDGRFPDTSRDFVGQGAANLTASVFGSIPSGGSMSGTAVSVQAGACSRWSNIFAGVTVVLIVFLFVDMVKLVPMAGLGGLLFVVGVQNVQPKSIAVIWRTGTMARAGFTATLVATLLLPLQFAILLGIAISFVLQILRSANQIEVRQISLVEGGFPIERPGATALEEGEITVLRIRGELFFASAQALEAQLPEADTGRHSVVLLVLRDVDDLGSTIIRLLSRYSKELEHHDSKLVLTGVNNKLQGQLKRTGLLKRLSQENVFEEQAEIGAALNDAMEQSRIWIDAKRSQSSSTLGSEGRK